MKPVIWSLLLVSLFGCTKANPVAPNSSLMVLRAYLYAHEPISDIRITSTLPLGSPDSVATPINTADVFLLKNGGRYHLTPTPGDSGYYHYEGNTLTVEPADEFEIEVHYAGSVATGKTVVPAPPQSVSLSSDTLTVTDAQAFGPRNSFFFSDTSSITIHWDNEGQSEHYVVVKNIDTDPIPISSEGDFPIGRRPRAFISLPISVDSYRVTRLLLTHLGKHRATVYTINQEYADLYRSRSQDSRNLNEPLTNMKNGLGIFSAFSSQSIDFYVKKE